MYVVCEPWVGRRMISSTTMSLQDRDRHVHLLPPRFERAPSPHVVPSPSRSPSHSPSPSPQVDLSPTVNHLLLVWMGLLLDHMLQALGLEWKWKVVQPLRAMEPLAIQTTNIGNVGLTTLLILSRTLTKTIWLEYKCKRMRRGCIVPTSLLLQRRGRCVISIRGEQLEHQTTTFRCKRLWAWHTWCKFYWWYPLLCKISWGSTPSLSTTINKVIKSLLFSYLCSTNFLQSE